MLEWIPWVIVGMNALASILWGVQARRALKEQIAAKDAALLARDAQIETLRELTSAKVMEHFSAMKSQLEGFIDMLEKQINEKDRELQGLKDDKVSRSELIDEWQKRKVLALEVLREKEKLLEAVLEERGREVAFPLDLNYFSPKARDWVIKHQSEILSGSVSPEELAQQTGLHIAEARGFSDAIRRRLKIQIK